MFNKCNYAEVAKCDLTTLSRWVSGKTVPSLYKQYLVCIVLDIDLLDYIIKIDTDKYKDSKKDQEAIDVYNSYLNNSNSIITYFQRNKNVDIYFDHLENKQHRETLDNYHGNFGSYIKIRNLVDTNKISKPFYIYLFKENEQLCGHISFTDDNEEYLKLFGVYDDTLKNTIGITPSYYVDTKIFWKVLSSLCYFYLSNKKYENIQFCTMSIRERKTLDFYKVIANAKSLTYFPPSDPSDLLDKGLHYVKFNLLLLLSKPSVIKHFKNFIVEHPETSFKPIL